MSSESENRYIRTKVKSDCPSGMAHIKPDDTECVLGAWYDADTALTCKDWCNDRGSKAHIDGNTNGR